MKKFLTNEILEKMFWNFFFEISIKLSATFDPIIAESMSPQVVHEVIKLLHNPKTASSSSPVATSRVPEGFSNITYDPYDTTNFTVYAEKNKDAVFLEHIFSVAAKG